MSQEFRATLDDHTGPLIKLADPKASTARNWIGSSNNAPWQPPWSRLGLGYFDAGTNSLQRHYWDEAEVSHNDAGTCLSSYTAGLVKISMQRTFTGQGHALTEKYMLKNIGSDSESLNLAPVSFAIYAPIDDHYMTTSDALENHAHAHVWAHGGGTAWVKMNQMGGHGRDLGLIDTCQRGFERIQRGRGATRQLSRLPIAFSFYVQMCPFSALEKKAGLSGRSSDPYGRIAEGIIRSNLALFDEDGGGSSAWKYPTPVNGRPGHYADPYASDQNWALNHLLKIREEDGAT